jgi:hypothetical protein
MADRGFEIENDSPPGVSINMPPGFGGFGDAVVRARAFASEIVGSILATYSCEKNQSTLCRKSWVFSGRSGFLPRGKLTWWVRINSVKKLITVVVKINSLF